MAEAKRNRPAGNGAAQKSLGGDNPKVSAPVGPPHEGPTLLDHLDQLEDGRARRDLGQQVALNAADLRVRTAVWDTIGDLARRRAPFSAETVRARTAPLACGDGLLGAMFRKAKADGLIEHCGFVRAERPEARGRWIMQWRGAGGDR